MKSSGKSESGFLDKFKLMIAWACRYRKMGTACKSRLPRSTSSKESYELSSS